RSWLPTDLGRDGQRVDGAADVVAEDVVDHPVGLEARAALERVGNDDRPEVIAAAGEVLDLRRRPGNGRLDTVLELVRAGHERTRVATWRTAPALATLNEAMIDLTDKGAEKVQEFL